MELYESTRYKVRIEWLNSTRYFMFMKVWRKIRRQLKHNLHRRMLNPAVISLFTKEDKWNDEMSTGKHWRNKNSAVLESFSNIFLLQFRWCWVGFKCIVPSYLVLQLVRSSKIHFCPIKINCLNCVQIFSSTVQFLSAELSQYHSRFVPGFLWIKFIFGNQIYSEAIARGTVRGGVERGLNGRGMDQSCEQLFNF